MTKRQSCSRQKKKKNVLFPPAVQYVFVKPLHTITALVAGRDSVCPAHPLFQGSVTTTRPAPEWLCPPSSCPSLWKEIPLGSPAQFCESLLGKKAFLDPAQGVVFAPSCLLCQGCTCGLTLRKHLSVTTYSPLFPVGPGQLLSADR